MRTDLAKRPFPFTCHAVCRPSQPFFAFLACVVWVGFFFMLSMEEPEGARLTPRYFLLLAAFGLCGLVMIPIRAGFREVLPNRPVVLRGATWVVPKVIPIELLVTTFAGVLILTSGVIYTHSFGGLGPVLIKGINSTIVGPGFVVLGSWVALFTVWQQLRGIKMTPESITYWRGIGTITLRWDELGDAISTNDVRDHEGYRKYLHKYVPGAKIVVPVERVMGVKLMVRWEDVDTPRLLLETDHFTVEPSALLTAILALRDHPELRPLLGTRDSKVLFVGPPWRVRRHLYRTQQWWPRGAAPDGIAIDRDGVVKEFQ